MRKDVKYRAVRFFAFICHDFGGIYQLSASQIVHDEAVVAKGIDSFPRMSPSLRAE